MNNDEHLRFDAASAKRFEEAYKFAVERGWETFTFGGHDWLTSYAKYVCEYLHTKFTF